jgi:hypothetical protein
MVKAKVEEGVDEELEVEDMDSEEEVEADE